jgi:hypothetical protein
LADATAAAAVAVALVAVVAAIAAAAVVVVVVIAACVGRIVADPRLVLLVLSLTPSSTPGSSPNTGATIGAVTDPGTTRRGAGSLRGRLGAQEPAGERFGAL